MLAVSSCTTTKTLYSWYDYEDATYQYHKRSTEELQVKVLEQYKKITDKQKGVRGVVPPGMYAEYGYLLYKTGKKDEGLSFLKRKWNSILSLILTFHESLNSLKMKNLYCLHL